MKQNSSAIITSEYTGSLGRTRIFMFGLFDDKLTEVDVDTQYSDPRIYAINKDAAAMYNGKCNYAKLNGYPVSAINGSWTGYKLQYDKTYNASQTSYASIKCIGQQCGLLTNNGAYSMTFSEFNLNTAWTTKKGSKEIAGAVLSDDRNLMSLFFCKAPLSDSNVLDACSFYTFKRS